MIELKNRLAGDPNWNGGWYYQRGGIARTLTALRIDTLKRYGYGEWLAAKYADAGARDRALHDMAESWAQLFDANGMLTVLRASSYYDAEKDFAKIRAKLL